MNTYFKYLVLCTISYVFVVVHAMDSIDSYEKFKTAIIEEDKQKVKRLIAAGVNVNAQDDAGDSPLLLATTCCYTPIVKLLLKHGADINVQNWCGWTALMDATTAKEAYIVELLLKYGADVTIKDREGKTALDYAKEDHAYYAEKEHAYPYTSTESKAECKSIGKMLLKVYINQRKLKGAQAAAVQTIEKEHPGISPRAISRYFK